MMNEKITEIIEILHYPNIRTVTVICEKGYHNIPMELHSNSSYSSPTWIWCFDLMFLFYNICIWDYRWDCIWDLDGRVDETVDGRVDGTVDGTVDWTVDGTIDGTVDGTIGGTIDGTVDEIVDGTVDGTIDGTIYGTVQQSSFTA